MVWRGIQVEHEPGPRLFCLRHRLGMPDVFTDTQGHRYLSQLKDDGLTAFIKITLFVKDLVIGQILLRVLRRPLTIEDHPSHVVYPTILYSRIAQDDSNRELLRPDMRKGTLNSRGKARTQQQVFRWVSGQCQLSKDNRRGLVLIHSAPCGSNAPFSITGDISHQGVDLSQCDRHT